MEKHRCGWCGSDSLYRAYHDTEWGVPLRNDRGLFEFLILETFQAGLSWITVLRKREAFRKAFDGFDWEAIAGYNEAKIQALLADPGIIRNRLKVRAAVSNAAAFAAVQRAYGSFSAYYWGFTDGKPQVNAWADYRKVPARTPLSEALSKDLKKKGFTFVGPTVVYAFMQATGMVNDHETQCFRYHEV